ncbi:hypothetical protein P3J6_120428 [Pseudoalteromonas sp. 3J6]|nr:hypothetical protein P3J6_120428 [Pseudoalteromonas sp. 3J6]
MEDNWHLKVKQAQYAKINIRMIPKCLIYLFSRAIFSLPYV